MQGVAKQGYTLVEIMIVVAIFAILATIALPGYIHSRDESWKNACVSNLRQIQGATEQAMLVRNGTIEYDSLFGANGYIKTKPICPISKVDYTLEGSVPKCPIQGHVLPE